MKKALLISGGILLLLAVLGFWYFLFVFGTPKEGDIFANFGLGGKEPIVTETDYTPVVEENVIPVTEGVQTLRQLTTRPVAGMTFVNDSTARFVERGTGHVFDISLQTGAETQVSNTTFSKARDAVFSASGNGVGLSYDDAGTDRMIVGTISKDALTSIKLTSGATGLAFSTIGNTAYYLLETAAGTEGHAYDLAEKTDEVIFTVPFGNARAIWKHGKYVYTKPSASLLGYVYDVSGGTPQFITSGGQGLMATPFRDGIITTTVAGGVLTSTAHINDTKTNIPLEIFPEKCTTATSTIGDLLCGGAIAFADRATYPDDWYKGTVSQRDMLWKVDIERGEAVLLTDPESETGNSIDVANITTDSTGTSFLIINKNDETLWLFDPLAGTSTN